jgi:hypothetical protein
VQGGAELPNPVIIRVLGTDGNPVAKIPVGFSVVQGGGSVSPGSAPSDENGEVKVKWTVGPNEVAQMLRATVPGVEAVNVIALALLPSDIIVAQGNNQIAKAGAALPNPIVIRIVGPGNVPMKGIAVAFQVVSGGGLISPQSGLTNALGEVTRAGRWVAPPEPTRSRCPAARCSRCRCWRWGNSPRQFCSHRNHARARLVARPCCFQRVTPTSPRARPTRRVPGGSRPDHRR